jgi:hypothetical protein
MSNESVASRLRTAVVVPSLMLGVLSAIPVGAQSGGDAPTCRADGPVVKVPELPEMSGLAASRVVRERLWAHNDSGKPVLLALDARGTVTARVTVSGAKVEDWEAVAVGPCPAGSCIHVFIAFPSRTGTSNRHRPARSFTRHIRTAHTMRKPC